MRSRDRRGLLRRAVLALAAVLPSACGGGGDLRIEDAWVRAAPPSSEVLAGYFTLHNRMDESITIAGARSSAFGRVEIHETVTRDGAVGMRRTRRLAVGPGESLILAPGGRHLMLMQPRGPIAPGKKLEIVLELEGADELRFTAEVRAGDAL